MNVKIIRRIKDLSGMYWKTSLSTFKFEEQLSDILEEYASQQEVVSEDLLKLSNDNLCDLLKQVSEWVNQENQFMPLEYLGLLKEWMQDKISTKYKPQCKTCKLNIDCGFLTEYTNDTCKHSVEE